MCLNLMSMGQKYVVFHDHTAFLLRIFFMLFVFCVNCFVGFYL